MGWFRRVIAGNARVTTAVYAVPDAFAVQAASLGMVTNPFSASSAGVHSPGTSSRGFIGDRGYGENRWAGRTTYPLQTFGQAVVPVAEPASRRLGVGAMPSGQPGLPGTAGEPGMASLARMSMLGNPGLGG
jgi:hypothetical protein